MKPDEKRSWKLMVAGTFGGAFLVVADQAQEGLRP